ncbi:VWA domain-containing protein [Acaryochloris sp. 'Moss Beach']|uniref:vWA domain-containing protein n=1 Tax=Acaryochloris sp. 'Moss Beach' TaxID=2740837 RepID=UPI001F43E65B|nr:vWA domain-containing protein [Acaryochloris sp. 'Moss Beach']UJB68978.1 VWA domain-containing protein [Acaryochloris sp. 'Moss Beach']
MLLLNRDNFSITLDDQDIPIHNWKSPEEAAPPPAWIIFLVDFSGSMNREDGSNITKLDGAESAIKQFNQSLVERAKNADIHVSLVPFGLSSDKCSQGYPVNAKTLDKFVKATQGNLKNLLLERFSTNEPCASTDLYSPLLEATKFLTNPEEERFNPSDGSNKPNPRLSIILLSDGYHNNEEVDKDKTLEALKRLTSQKTNFVIHTLGYGLTPEELQKKYKLTQPANIDHVRSGKVPELEFVDRGALEQIADLTKGIHEFSGDAKEISEEMQIFLDSILGEYEISYIQSNPERGARHEVQVTIDDDQGEAIASVPKPYRIKVFGRSPTALTRLSILGLTLAAIGLLGVLPFWIWAKKLKNSLE